MEGDMTTLLRTLAIFEPGSQQVYSHDFYLELHDTDFYLRFSFIRMRLNS